MEIPENTICGWCNLVIPTDSKVMSNSIVTIVQDTSGRVHKYSNSINKRKVNEESRKTRGTKMSGTNGFDETTEGQANDGTVDDLAEPVYIFGGGPENGDDQ